MIAPTPTKKPRVKLINTAYGDVNKEKVAIPYTAITRRDLCKVSDSEKL
jgi:hypothetical protein